MNYLTSFNTSFDQLLSAQPAADLQRIAKLWGGSGAMRKEVALDTIRKGLNNPKLAAAFVQRLEPAERAALSFLRLQPSSAAMASLVAVVVVASGCELPARLSPHEAVHTTIARMLAHNGLALSQYERYSYSYSSAYGSDPMLIADPRLLEHVPLFSGIPLTLPAVSEPADRRMRRPAQVVLDLIGFIEAMRAIGGLQINKNQTLRVGDQRKLIKALGWTDEWGSFDGMRFYQPAPALLDMLTRMGVVVVNDEDRLVVGANNLASLPYDQIIRQAISAFPGTVNWFEYALSYQSEAMVMAASALRIGLVSFLRRIIKSEGFLAFDDISRAYFDCVGREYSLMGMHPRVPRPWTYPNKTLRGKADGTDATAIEAGWRERQWEEWQKHEEPWLAYALAGWLYFLGMVELGIETSHIASLRLTDLGRSVLDVSRTISAPQQPTGPAWVVQPNFELTVFLEQASATQIMAIERAADRIQTDVHTASYRLTRESVARWLNQAETIDSLQSLLGSATPQNVITTIREWSGQFERITLRRKISLIEYATTEARNTALSTGIGGKPLGERFVLLDPHAIAPKAVGRVLDYTQPAPITLTSTEHGLVKVTRDTPDLVGRAILDRWGERINRGWQLSAASVAAAVERGYRVEELIQALDQRSIYRTTPMLLKISLRSWGGSPPQLMLGEVLMLQFPDTEIADAIADGKRFEGLLQQRVGPVSFLISKADLPSLTQELSNIGIIPVALKAAITE